MKCEMFFHKMWNVHETSRDNFKKEIKMNGFKKVALFLKVIVSLLAQRTFGNPGVTFL